MDGLDSIRSERVHYIIQAFREHGWSGCILSETWNWVLVSGNVLRSHYFYSLGKGP